MEAQWSLLENYLFNYNAEIISDLNPPATDAEIYDLESGIGMSLPEDFISFLKIHNGQKGNAEWIFDGEEFLSTKKIFRTWSILRTLQDNGDFDGLVPCAQRGVKDCWWSQKWIPFTSNGMGDHLCLDLDPSPHGVYGQVIGFFHDSPVRNTKATGFGNWFGKFVEGKGGRYE